MLQVRPAAVGRRSAARATRVVRAAEEEKTDAAPDAFAGLKPTKASEFKSMSNDDLLAQITSAKKMLYELRIRQSTRKEYKGSHFGILKAKIAQIRTVKREREIAEGVNKRDSRKIKREEKNANLYL
jgi:large subunit ribosomal protein L29